MNYHCAVEAQMYAIDIVKINDKGQFFEGEGKELKDFYTMGENIYSPVAGTIINFVDSLIINSVKYNVTPIGMRATMPAIKLFLSLVKNDFFFIFSSILRIA